MMTNKPDPVLENVRAVADLERQAFQGLKGLERLSRIVTDSRRKSSVYHRAMCPFLCPPSAVLGLIQYYVVERMNCGSKSGFLAPTRSVRRDTR